MEYLNIVDIAIIRNTFQYQKAMTTKTNTSWINRCLCWKIQTIISLLLCIVKEQDESQSLPLSIPFPSWMDCNNDRSIAITSFRFSQSWLAMIILEKCKQFKSIDWIYWKLSKSETIHLLRHRNGIIIIIIKIIPHVEMWIIRIHTNWWKLFQWSCWRLWIGVCTIIAIYSSWISRGMTENKRKVHFLPNNRGSPFSTIFDHFLPFPAWLPYCP